MVAVATRNDLENQNEQIILGCLGVTGDWQYASGICLLTNIFTYYVCCVAASIAAIAAENGSFSLSLRKINFVHLLC